MLASVSRKVGKPCRGKHDKLHGFARRGDLSGSLRLAAGVVSLQIAEVGFAERVSHRADRAGLAPTPCDDAYSSANPNDAFGREQRMQWNAEGSIVPTKWTCFNETKNRILKKPADPNAESRWCCGTALARQRARGLRTLITHAALARIAARMIDKFGAAAAKGVKPGLRHDAQLRDTTPGIGHAGLMRFNVLRCMRQV